MSKHSQRVGSRRRVWNGTAKQTQGGLKRKDLFKDKYGNLKSKSKQKQSVVKILKGPDTQRLKVSLGYECLEKNYPLSVQKKKV